MRSAGSLAAAPWSYHCSRVSTEFSQLRSCSTLASYTPHSRRRKLLKPSEYAILRQPLKLWIYFLLCLECPFLSILLENSYSSFKTQLKYSFCGSFSSWFSQAALMWLLLCVSIALYKRKLSSIIVLAPLCCKYYILPPTLKCEPLRAGEGSKRIHSSDICCMPAVFKASAKALGNTNMNQAQPCLKGTYNHVCRSIKTLWDSKRDKGMQKKCRPAREWGSTSSCRDQRHSLLIKWLTASPFLWQVQALLNVFLSGSVHLDDTVLKKYAFNNLLIIWTLCTL